MRPLRLVMNAFGPYARPQTIDFTKLGDQSLFLIHGPTGSGKSSILDAICFALYGETSGDERKGAQMRSDHVDAETHTEVVYDFALGEQVYRVQRRPRYDVWLVDTERTRTRQPQAGLWSRTGLNGHDADGELLASGVTDVNDKVQALLGLRAEEFRQVVVLPQGRFRELLTSESKKRAEIFATLFRTGHYRRIQEALKALASDVRDRMKQTVLARDEALSQAGVDSPDALNDAIAEIGTRIDQLKTEQAGKRRAEADARQSHADSIEVDRKLRERASATAALHEIEERSDAIDEDRGRANQARKAAQLRDIEDEVGRLLAAAETSDGERDRIGEALKQATEAIAAAELEKNEAEATQPDIDQTSRDLDRLESLRPRIERLGKAEQAATEAAEMAKAAQQELDDVSGRHETLGEEKDAAQAKLVSARLQAATVDGLDREVNELNRRLGLRTRLDQAKTQLGEAREAYSSAVSGYELEQSRREDAEKRLREMEQSWHDGQAAILADSLSEGEPCPVCGAVHHPSPASSDEAIPDEAALNELRAAVKQHDTNANQTWQQKVQQEQEVKRLQSAIEELTAELGVTAEHPVEQIDQAVEDVNSKLSTARGAAAEIPGLEQEIERLGGVIEAATTEKDEKQSALTSAQAAAQAARTALEFAEAEVPEEHRTLELLEQAITAATEKIDSLTGRITTARAAFDAASSAHQTLTAEHKSAVEEAGKDRQIATGRQAVFVDRRVDLGFETEDDYLAAKLDEREIERLEQRVRDHDDAITVARERLKAASVEAEGLTQPDLEGLQEIVDAAKSALEESIEAASAAAERRKHLADSQKRIERLSHEFAQLESDYEIAEYLSSVAIGDGKYTEFKVSFERFVQAAFLDEVLYVATQRLSTMSNGRYQLERSRESGDRRRAGGLDLEVFDVHTGAARGIGTLSGGEGFLAALALALGLSEVVQSHAGGIRLDTLFVDEGFGSLDPAALDKALDVLVGLHRGRLVGIISHVPELQERIEARLRVRSYRDGSVAEFIT